MIGKEISSVVRRVSKPWHGRHGAFRARVELAGACRVVPRAWMSSCAKRSDAIAIKARAIQALQHGFEVYSPVSARLDCVTQNTDALAARAVLAARPQFPHSKFITRGAHCTEPNDGAGDPVGRVKVGTTAASVTTRSALGAGFARCHAQPRTSTAAAMRSGRFVRCAASQQLSPTGELDEAHHAFAPAFAGVVARRCAPANASAPGT